jgi:hypothetical protein
MPDPNRKSVADALAGMASGERPAASVAPNSAPANSATTRNPATGNRPANPAQMIQNILPADFAPPAGLRPTVRSRVEVDKALDRMQTFIPIFLTVGVLFCFLGIWVVSADFDSAILDVLPRWAGWVLLGTCVVSWGLAGWNMFRVAKVLKQNKPAALRK